MTGRGGDEVVELVPDVPSTDGWWARYQRALGDAGISQTSISMIRADCEYLIDRCILPGTSAPAPADPPRVRTGLVMGAVQSGKTASMFGVSAQALDAGFDMIVILAGTRVALWRQTYARALSQLFDEGAPQHRLMPRPEVALSEAADIRLDALYAVNRHRVRRLLRDHHPLVAIVMKNVHHIRAAARTLHESVYPLLDDLGRDLRILVLDDEADDGSILDAAVEQGLDPSSDDLKQVPRHIAHLWGAHGDGRTTIHPRLTATYIAYTATPQANLLQADHNPLAPRDFVAALRTPGPHGELEPRGPSYRDPAGLARWYTGGEVFHRTLGRTTLIVSDPPPGADDTDDHAAQLWQARRSLQAYLVAGAIRLWRSGKRYDPDALYETRDAALTQSPEPHSMLFHPSARVADHFAAAALILETGHGVDHDAALQLVHAGERSLSNGRLEDDLRSAEEEWRAWLSSYRETAALVRDHFGLADTEVGSIPSDDEWGEIADILADEVIPSTRISIINSDPAADDRPQFEPVHSGDGRWRPAPDLATIFISGNVMARGLTLEGLTTTLFLRSSADPIADTQQQMQRWFGYRGRYIELCRVFLSRTQRELFEQYHEADEALRRQIIAAMDTSDDAPSPTVLRGREFRATGKISGLGKIPLCPGATPLVAHVHRDGGTEENRRLLADLVRQPHTAVWVSGVYRGHLLDQSLTLLEAAELLEGLRYHDYVPDPSDELVRQWRTVEDQMGLDDGHTPLFRAPSPGPGVRPSPVIPSSCPYTIAAYLRLWHACLTRHARGLFPTDDATTPWSAMNLEDCQRSQPRFWMAIRNGRGARITGEGFDDLDPPISAMDRSVEEDRLSAGWGGRSSVARPGAYRGDALFDHHLRPGAPEPISFGGSTWRPRGSDGLILFMPVQVEGREPVFAVGVAIPLGGPDRIAASKAVA